MRAEGNTRGGSELHGGDGPLTVSDLRNVNPLSRVFIDAGQQAGLPRNDDFNGPSQPGVGLYPVTQRGRAPCPPAVAYIPPAKSRPTLTGQNGLLHPTRVVLCKSVTVHVNIAGRLNTNTKTQIPIH